MATPRRMTRHDRRDSFLDVAAALIDDAGLAALSFDSLAEAAGVAKSLPYAYFSSTGEILLTLFDRIIGGIDERVEAVLSSGEDFESLVRRSLEVWFDAASDHPGLIGALLDGRAFPALARAVAERDRSSHQRWHDIVRHEFSLSDHDAHLVASMLNSTATATVEFWTGRKGPRAAIIDSFVTMVSAAGAALQRHD